MNSELFANAATEKEFPDDGLPEVAVAGRSNVGKSSFINALLGRRSLARTSRTPGRTRRLHFYRVDDGMYLVDLPGYGYAAVAREERGSWRPMVEAYLRATRAPLRGVIVLVDARRGPEDEERDLLAWLATEGIPARLVFTKRDKLKPNRLAQMLRKVSEREGLAVDQMLAVSSTSRAGLGGVASWIRERTGFKLIGPDGSDLPR
jgi:GTP-binding protein